MPLLAAMKDLVDTIMPFLDPEKIGEEESANISKKIEILQAELDDPFIQSDVERKTVTNFDDWDERVKDVVEFVRPDNSIIQFPVHSLTSAEMKDIRNKRFAAEPKVPEPRRRGDGKIDENDPHINKERRIYDEEMKKINDLNVLWVLEYGLEFEIPGSNEDEKLKYLDDKVAGDAAKIAAHIMDISNLTPETVRPFSMT